MYIVGDLMKKPITVSKDCTISNAIKKLLDEKISRLLVSDGNKITSIVTEKDLSFFLLSDKTERTLDQVYLKEIMKPVFSIEKSVTIKECAKTMIEKGIGSLAVKSDGKIVGIITRTDLIKYYAENFAGKKTVGEYSSPDYAWAYSDVPLYSVVEKMRDKKISRLILRDKNETPKGILSFRDLFWVSLYRGNEESLIDNTNPDVPIFFKRKGFISESGFGGTTTAEQVMTNKIITVNDDDDLAKICNILLEKAIKGVGVCSRKGTMIGILSKTDIVRCMSFMN